MQIIIPPELMAYCALATAIYLLVVNWALGKYERNLIARGAWKVPAPSDSSQDTENSDGSDTQSSSKMDFINRFIMQWLIFAALPMGLYSWLYLLLPLEGPRAGIAIALWTIVVGALPFAVLISDSHKVPFVALAFLMFSQVIRLLGVLAIIGVLFSL